MYDSLKYTFLVTQLINSYRKCALEFNPERLQDETSKKVFALIGEAYDVLSDPLRRAVYDQYGEEGLKRGVPISKENYFAPYHYHGDPMRTYRNFFGTTSPYADLMDYLLNPPPLFDQPEGRGIRKKQPPIYHILYLTLHEVFFGGVKKMKIQRLQFVDEKKNRTEIKEKILSIPIKPGLRPKTQIVCPEEGDQNPTQIPADVIFVTEDRPHETFHRENDDLVMTADISLQDALLGTTVVVNTIDHRTVRVPITDIVHPGYEKIVPNEGMPILENPNTKGNLIIRFNIHFPDYLPKACKEIMQKAFICSRAGGGFGQDEMINKIVLADKILRVDPDEQMPPCFN
ncbi:dnaJ homolog subfamily B member 13-like [Agrilus planipennis]|uniref:DnaJ homolog subfamily B member 13-like n=1 Tax=Agrilus planipennis TaxID=224129 RepID=A0A1W4XAP1_AGRPL|nr:dnaJ homolog subfamily B member 13-like [Agrilus planipennis]